MGPNYWASKQPNNYDSRQRCVSCSKSNDFKYGDEYCNDSENTYGFFCEFGFNYVLGCIGIFFLCSWHDVPITNISAGVLRRNLNTYQIINSIYIYIYLCHHLLLLYIHDWKILLIHTVITNNSILNPYSTHTYIRIFHHHYLYSTIIYIYILEHVPAVSVGQSSCYNDGKFYAAGKCMSIHTMNNEEKSWFHARHRCNLISGRLLEVDNSEIMNFMRDDLRDNKDINGHIRYWIGASRITTTWQNGSCIIVLRNPAPIITYIHVYVYDCCLWYDLLMCGYINMGKQINSTTNIFIRL